MLSVTDYANLLDAEIPGVPAGPKLQTGYVPMTGASRWYNFMGLATAWNGQYLYPDLNEDGQTSIDPAVYGSTGLPSPLFARLVDALGAVTGLAVAGPPKGYGVDLNLATDGGWWGGLGGEIDRDIGSGKFTLEMWRLGVRVVSSAFGGLIVGWAPVMSYNDGDRDVAIVEGSDGVMYLAIPDNSYGFGQQLVPLNPQPPAAEWYQLTLTSRDNDVAEAYLNGQLAASGSSNDGALVFSNYPYGWFGWSLLGTPGIAMLYASGWGSTPQMVVNRFTFVAGAAATPRPAPLTWLAMGLGLGL